MGGTCKNCGNTLENEDNFCQKCGTVVEEIKANEPKVQSQTNTSPNGNAEHKSGRGMAVVVAIIVAIVVLKIIF